MKLGSLSSKLRFSFKPLLILAVGFGLASCASASQEKIYAGDIEISDPFEKTNRSIFAFNQVVDNNVINPTIKGYRYIAPKPVRIGVHNFLVNLGTPIDFANQVLQADIPGAGTTLARAVVNTTVGIGGLIDVAALNGLENEPEDFGQTLAVWGVGNGPYVVAPILGPSTLRDYTGFFVDSFADPLNIYLNNIDENELLIARNVAGYIDLRESLHDVLKELETSSIDYYATVRSTYYQNRQAVIRDESAGGRVEVPDFDDF